MADMGQIWRHQKMFYALVIFILPFCLQFTSAVKLTYWYNPVDDVDRYKTVYNIHSNAMTWWEAAHSGCSQYDGQPFTLKSPFLPVRVSRILPYGYFWIGAVEFTMWKWTDGSSLYTYEGYGIRRFTLGATVPGNSPLACHIHCGGGFHWFGLQGNTCHCLNSHTKVYNKGDNPDVRCPGNYYYRCGDDNGMSVYSIVDLQQMPYYTTYKCGYVKVTENSGWFWREPERRLNVFLSRDCDNSYRKCAVCNKTGKASSYRFIGDISIGSSKKTWNEWNSTCSLSKLFPEIKDILVKNQLVSDQTDCDGYWIGLRRYSDRKWIDGRIVNISDDYVGVNTFPRCLAIHNLFGQARPVWTSCTSKYRSLCETFKPVPTTIFPSTTKLPKMTSSCTGTTVTRKWQEGNTSDYDNVTVLHRYADKHHSGQQGINSIGLYIGCGIGAVVLLILILTLVLSYRQKRFCFNPKTASEGRGNSASHFNTSDGRDITYSHPVSNSESYTVPVARMRPIYQNISLENDELDNPSYNDVPGLKLMNTVQTNGSNPDDTGDSHYDLPVSATQEHDLNDRNQTYDFVDEESVPVIAGMKHASEDVSSPYSLAGQQSFAPERSGNNNTKYQGEKPEFPDGLYNVTDRNISKRPMQQHNNSYDHVGTSAAADYYDTAGPTGPAKLSDTTYNHIDRVKTDYTENGVDEDNIYHCIDDSHIRAEIPEKVNVHFAGSAEDRSYYNVSFIPETETVNVSRQEGGNDNIYSLARTISDA